MSIRSNPRIALKWAEHLKRRWREWVARQLGSRAFKKVEKDFRSMAAKRCISREVVEEAIRINKEKIIIDLGEHLLNLRYPDAPTTFDHHL